MEPKYYVCPGVVWSILRNLQEHGDCCVVDYSFVGLIPEQV